MGTIEQQFANIYNEMAELKKANEGLKQEILNKDNTIKMWKEKYNEAKAEIKELNRELRETPTQDFNDPQDGY